MNVNLTEGFHATQGDLIKAFRGAFNDVADKEVFETVILPLVRLLAVNSIANGSEFNGPKTLEFCLKNTGEPAVQALSGMSVMFLCKMSELAFMELERLKREEENPARN